MMERDEDLSEDPIELGGTPDKGAIAEDVSILVFGFSISFAAIILI